MNVESEILAARILIVDERDATPLPLQGLLGEAGYTQVRAVQGTAQARALRGEAAPDLILLNLAAPAPTRFDLLDQLRPDSGEFERPVLVVAAPAGLKEQALMAGARSVIDVPFDPPEVRSRIHDLLELRLLNRKLQMQNAALERAVTERTAELQASEHRYRRLTELSTDGYWEQDDEGVFTQLAGRMIEMLGLHGSPWRPGAADGAAADGWNLVERDALYGAIAARRPFLDLPLHRQLADGRQLLFRISGEPMFDAGCTYVGYRGVGVEVTTAG